MEQNKPKLFREYFSLGIDGLCATTAKINGLSFPCYQSTNEMVHFNGFRFANHIVALTSQNDRVIIPICSKCKKELEQQILEMESKLEKSNE